MPQFQTDLDCEFLGELSATVYFDYTEGQEEVIHGPAEECQEGLEAEINIIGVEVLINGTTIDVMHMVPVFHVTNLEDRAIEFINEQDEE